MSPMRPMRQPYENLYFGNKPVSGGRRTWIIAIYDGGTKSDSVLGTWPFIVRNRYNDITQICEVLVRAGLEHNPDNIEEICSGHYAAYGNEKEWYAELFCLDLMEYDDDGQFDLVEIDGRLVIPMELRGVAYDNADALLNVDLRESAPNWNAEK